MTAIPARLAAGLADRYRLERELGQGGMATAYLAHDLKHDREVALLDESIGITKQIAGALEYAHTKGIIHRDVVLVKDFD